MEIPDNVVQVIAAYLAKQPYEEVAMMIGELQKAAQVAQVTEDQEEE